jgi:hypothetical protein
MKQFLLFLGMWFSVNAAIAAQVAPIILPPVKSSVFTLSQNDDLWFFNGPTPTNYNTTIQINAAGPSQGTFAWQVTTNQRAVSLNGGGSTASSQSNAPLSVTSSEISISSGDVTIHFQYNGSDVGDYPLTVFAPLETYTELRLTFNTVGDPTKIPQGFATFADYQLFDQFGDRIPRPLVLNEFIDRTTTVNVEFNTWPVGLFQNSGITSTILADFPDDPTPSFFQDKYGVAGVLIPLPQSPPSPPTAPSTEEVYNVLQKYFTGSATQQAGRQSSVQTLHFFRDHAVVETKN